MNFPLYLQIILIVVITATISLFALRPAVIWIYREFNSRASSFSGIYFSFTRLLEEIWLLELIQCRHTDNRLSGKSRLVCACYIKGNRLIRIKKSTGGYSFDGPADDTVFMFAHQTGDGGFLSPGTVSLKIDKPELPFIGTWIGVTNNHLQTARCFWIKTENALWKNKDDMALLKEANRHVDIIISSMSENENICPAGILGPLTSTEGPYILLNLELRKDFVKKNIREHYFR